MRYLTILALFLAAVGTAQAQQCPDTHYPCGENSCCSK